MEGPEVYANKEYLELFNTITVHSVTEGDLISCGLDTMGPQHERKSGF